MHKYLLILIVTLSFVTTSQAQKRGRIRDFGVKPGILTPGKLNAITDVKGVSVGQKTMKRDTFKNLKYGSPEYLKAEAAVLKGELKLV